IDLLVPSAGFERARQAILTDLDGVQPIPELRPGFDEEFGKEALLEVEGREVDLHRTFVTGPVGLTIPLDELFEERAALPLGGRSLPTLGPVASFLQACINAAVGDFPVRACSLRDVVQLSGVAEREADRVTATAERWGVGLVVKRAVDLAWPGLGLDDGPLSDWASGYRAGLRARLSLRSYLTPARSYTRPAASLLVIPGVRPRLRYVRSILFPQGAYLASRGWGLRSHARRAMSGFRRR
ncbi:MAG: nucleotidyltransferase family protein, partial [Acidimicrobiia bacterium]|nr:nucleotidyltransferase family protein [Acidimicrobiia bacterium]